jgi:NTE family protein
MQKGVYRLGIYLEGVYSFQPFFNNYTSSLLSAHAFEPIPDAQTGFYNDFRSNKYVGGGLINIFTIKDKVDLRVDAYLLQPFYRIQNATGEAIEGELFEGRFGMGSVSLIYHSLIGPLRATVNYIPGQSILDPLSFQVSFGYVLFNRRALR